MNPYLTSYIFNFANEGVLYKEGYHGMKDTLDRCLPNIAKKTGLSKNEILNTLSDQNFIDLLCLSTVKAGTTLYHGAMYKFDKWPRDNKEFSLRNKGTQITTYKGAWFSANDKLSEYYAIKPLDNPSRWRKNIKNVEFTLSLYRAKRDIPMMLNLSAFKYYTTPNPLGEHTVQQVNVGALKTYIKLLISNGKLQLRDGCNLREFDELLGNVTDAEFAESNYFLAAALCKCVKGVNGWIHIDDSMEFFICNPEQYLEFVEKHIMSEFFGTPLDSKSLGKTNDDSLEELSEILNDITPAYADGYQSQGLVDTRNDVFALLK